jgi:hypothetical protein
MHQRRVYAVERMLLPLFFGADSKHSLHSSPNWRHFANECLRQSRRWSDMRFMRNCSGNGERELGKLSLPKSATAVQD